MKYMGSKRTMLSNGLGETLLREIASSRRFADLFLGSSAVAWHVAEKFRRSVIGADLQKFAVILAEAVIARDKPIASKDIWERWSAEARKVVLGSQSYDEAKVFDRVKWGAARRRNVEAGRDICRHQREPVMRAYGAHYFSPMQALVLDSLRTTLPQEPIHQKVALAALICAASQCAASPGHTAQPFQPTKGAARFLFEAWRRDVWEHTRSALERICPKHARRAGTATVQDAESLAKDFGPEDLAFVDPPYSGVHYSRFYHVLETIARGDCEEVSGVGRYPPPSERPKSDFSVSTKSKLALERLLSILAERGVRTIVTFPQEKTSNGLSGSIVEDVANEYFKVSKQTTNGRFSTLGGNLVHRKARIPAYEVILSLSPRN
jgi:adenine-specific DNA-methyltransferase